MSAYPATVVLAVAEAFAGDHDLVEADVTVAVRFLDDLAAHGITVTASPLTAAGAVSEQEAVLLLLDHAVTVTERPCDAVDCDASRHSVATHVLRQAAAMIRCGAHRALAAHAVADVYDDARLARLLGDEPGQ